MAGRALLINPSYFRTYGSNEGGIAFPVFPVMGLASIAGAVVERGHDVRILDLSYRRYDPVEIRREIEEYRPDIVGITASTPLANQMRDISHLVKDVSPGIVTIGGGAHASALPAETVRQSALDLVAAGEADTAVAALLDGVDPATIGGLWRRDGDLALAPSSAGPLLDDLDTLPWPAWDRYPLDGNRRLTKIVARHRPAAMVEFSRGCIYRCDFCGSKNTVGNGYRKKSPERCAEELVRMRRLGFREAMLVDDIFTSDNDWAAAVCEAVIRSGADMAWTCSTGIRVDSANLELFQLMKRAGCYRVYFGFESGSDHVLQAFGKGGQATLDQGVEAVDLARRAGLEPNGYFLVGLSGDDEASMQSTIDYAGRVRLDTMKCGICIPFPGTPMFDELHRAGRIKTYDWDEYTVYNQAESIYDHPTLPWPTITAAFRRFYSQTYFRNPAYVLRRLAFMVRNHEILWNVYFTVKFWLMLVGRPKPPETEPYEFEDRWRPSDLGVGDVLGTYAAPRARKAADPAGRNGVVVGAPRRRPGQPVTAARTSG